LARTENPNLVLLDLMMPDMDGWQVCEAIRSFSQVPIIVFSALGKSKEIARAMDLGANLYLEKPIPGDVLVETINKLALQAE
jgi:DNA-binding response OmpR family regulator